MQQCKRKRRKEKQMAVLENLKTSQGATIQKSSQFVRRNVI